ncbi:FKBP-type peptidyl-prolyl cis-trans isomerase [Thiocapsa roseopersicina]|uniref:peptidylprolyl isomerase n=1 Tax=Thiocapsa roseopersicina TaxID=1058 RepID=A0A1H3BD22_THIRO|nr:peptidylprolyl isomerase [Thiocapsa roseopersicina]SDX39832.1 FKBP-type peptidyl prolyl cis-trans isomerase /Apo-metallochaperone SlyD [Thiocapsa roseopersicina]
MAEQLISAGMLVALTYRIEDGQGNILEQTDIPVSYIHGGQTELIGGMDAAVDGRRAGDEVELVLGPDQGFGPRDPDLTFTDAFENVPPEFRFVGAEVQMENEVGETRQFQVTRIEGGKLTVDGNHPLAGKTLRVHVRIEEVRDPTHAELTADLGGGGMLPGGGLH